MAFPLVVVMFGEGSLMNIASALSLEYNFSILELLVEDLSEDKALFQSMPSPSMIGAKVRNPFLDQSGCWFAGGS